jgi:phage pi2 protein 07
VSDNSKSVSIEGKVWSVKHCANNLGVHENFYRRNILNNPDHPKAINPENHRWSFWSSKVKKFHAELVGE